MWKDSYLIGNEKIDSQHKELFKNAEVLLDSLKNIDSPEYKRFFKEYLGFFKNYVVNHFHDEEEYASSVGYADLERHRRLHIKLTKEVLSYEKELIASGFAQPVIKSFLGFLSTWLIYHVAGEDQRIPKAFSAETKVGTADDFMHEFADKAIQAIRLILGMPDDDISYKINSIKYFKPITYFIIDLHGYPEMGVEFAYSREFALGVFKGVTGIEQRLVNEITYSALSELSNILGTKFADILTVSGSCCTAGRPEQSNYGVDESQITRKILLITKAGSMEVAIYIKGSKT